MNLTKIELYNYCLRYINERIETAQGAITNAKEASESETKSSAGDKYETGRAMAQQDIDRNQAQLIEASKLRQILERINPESTSDIVHAGSLVITDNGRFYVAISAGQITLEGETYFAISAGSPIGSRLIGKRKGDQFDFNGKTYRVLNAC